MKPFLFLIGSSVLFYLTISDQNIIKKDKSIKEEPQVYICNSKTSKKYHYKKGCRGLNNCKAAIKEITLKEAKNRGRTLCGWED